MPLMIAFDWLNAGAAIRTETRITIPTKALLILVSTPLRIKSGKTETPLQ
jgi:hypothetical protein